MSIESQDRELSLAMRKVLAYAKEQMSESIICIISFTTADDEPDITLQKIVVNVEHRDELINQSIAMLENFRTAPVIDLTDTTGGMQ